ncbi:MAG TPA: VWA domain-containing protein, partial [Polyangiaceae bacterium]|nr:VWA domain-containing protein [Polyangiaceae bacterium]
ISGPLLLVLLEAVRWLELRWVRFSRPLACLPVFVTQAWILLRLRGYGARTSAARRRAFESSVGAAVALAGLAVSGLEIGHAVDRLTILIALDRSRSIELVPGAETRIERELAVAELGMRPSDRIGTVAFAADARIEDPVRPKSTLRGAQRVDIARDGTDISQAIRQALSSIPPDSAARIAILSDGVATRGDTLEAALAASALGVPIDVVALDQGSPKDVRVVSVRVPPHGAKGETLDVRIVTHASQQTRVTIRLLRDGDLIREGPATLAQGEDVVTLREIAPEPGLHRYDVELSVEDRSVDRAPEDNSGSAFMRVRGESTALVLDSDPAFGAATAQALRNAAFLVDTAGPTGIPADLAGLARYDLIVLGDISAPEFSPQQLLAMQSYVRDLGGGLLLLGGDKTMGPGGFARTPIEEVSPVSFDLKQERRRASLAEVIAIDYSGSMAATVDGRTKLELANEAAARSSELLGEGDRLGVMHVDTAVSWTLPLANVTDTAEIGNRIRRVGPGGGGIFIDLSLSAAYQALARESVQLKHLLLFSDGGDAEERARAPGLVERAREKGITTSVVALGNGSDVPALSRMAELGGGRFYLIEDAARLPAVFAQETVLATRSAIHEVAFVPHPLSPSRVLSGVSLQQAPPLKGYVVTLPKPRAQVLLAGPEADPILATWSVGVGRAGAFTSDYKDRWGSEWLGWPAAARLFAQLGRDLGRRLDDPKVRFEASTQNGELTLQASVVDEQGRHASFRQLTARV